MIGLGLDSPDRLSKPIGGLFPISSLAKTVVDFIHSASNPVEQAFLDLTRPSRRSTVLGAALDITRPRAERISENALLRQQLILLHRQVKKPRFKQADRLWLVLLATRVQSWKSSLHVLKPDTPLRQHRQGLRLFWKFKSRVRAGRPRLAGETIALIQLMARENSLRGTEP